MLVSAFLIPFAASHSLSTAGVEMHEKLVADTIDTKHIAEPGQGFISGSGGFGRNFGGGSGGNLGSEFLKDGFNEANFLASILHTSLWAILGIWAGIVTVPFLAWCICCKDRQRKTTQVAKESFSGDFLPVTLCQCCSSCMNCCETFMCYECMWAELAGKMKMWSCSVWFWLVAVWFFLFGSIFLFGTTLMAWTIIQCCLRMKIRERMNQGPSNCCMDFICHCCCSPCATYQEMEFSEHYEAVNGPLLDKVESAPA